MELYLKLIATFNEQIQKQSFISSISSITSTSIQGKSTSPWFCPGFWACGTRSVSKQLWSSGHQQNICLTALMVSLLESWAVMMVWSLEALNFFHLINKLMRISGDVWRVGENRLGKRALFHSDCSVRNAMILLVGRCSITKLCGRDCLRTKMWWQDLHRSRDVWSWRKNFALIFEVLDVKSGSWSVAVLGPQL